MNSVTNTADVFYWDNFFILTLSAWLFSKKIKRPSAKKHI